jgi:hypothetical protein
MYILQHKQMWLQDDEAPLHFSRAVREFFNEDYDGIRTGKDVPVACSFQSNLNPSDFFL